MPKGIDRFVSENRQATNRIDSTFVEVSSRRRKQFDFGTSTFRIPTSIEVYTRPLNDSLISGHPNPSQGSGSGSSGDQRGSWTLQTEEEMSEAFLRQGRIAIRNALMGNSDGAIWEMAVGDGTDDATPSNTQLQNETGRAFAWANHGSTANTTRSRSHLTFGKFNDSVTEFGVESQGGDLYNRITTTAVNPSETEELRVDIIFEVQGDGRGGSVITDNGEIAVAESMRSTDTVVGFEEYTFGSGNTEPVEGDTDLDNELFTKTCENKADPEVVSPHTVVFEAEPGSQPHTIREMGLKDNNGRLLWRTTIDPYDKDDTVEFEVYSGFRAK